MCGIAGILNAKPEHRDITQKMLDLINHRGPDDQGITEDFDRRICLGSKRLSIIDLSPKGKMPMINQEGTVAVCQNGEIYNYQELRKELTQAGYQFQSASDTEVILHGYAKWGEKVFAKLNGMFAIAIFDYQTGSAFLARDRIGIKPLYYLTLSDTLFFASEVKAFKAVSDYDLKQDLDPKKLELVLGFMFLPDSANTLFKRVKRVKPGEYLKWEAATNKLSTHSYWTLPYATEDRAIGFEEAVDNLDNLLKNSVTKHLVADVPLGILLSGGLDSSLIAAYAQQLSKKRVKTYTASFNHKLNESKNAAEVANYLGTEHHEVFIDTKDVVDQIERYLPIYDDMTTFDGGVISTSILAKKLKDQGITVILLGEGADELFGGYSWFGLAKQPFTVLPRLLKSAAYYYAISRNISFKTPNYIAYWNTVWQKQNQPDIFRTISATELTTQLPNHLLMKVDKATMSASVEARVPYLDHRIVEYVFNLPHEYKIKGQMVNLKNSHEKYILRKVAERYLPPAVFTRKKRGFMLPMFDVLTSNLDKVRSYVLAADGITAEIVGKKSLPALFDFNCPGPLKMQREYLLWRIFLLEAWYKLL
ncbi:MAG: asparagine synthase (glutamine-hydrolyzing) [bacterium]